jgi:predicted outer membrane repeat protein
VAQGVYVESVSCDPYEEVHGGYDPINWTNNPAANPTVLDGNNEDATVVLSEGSAVVGCTIRHGKRDQGGGVYCLGVSVRISQCILENNTATVGGSAVYGQNVSLKVTDCVVRNNIRDAIKIDGGTIECSGTTISDTEAFAGMAVENGEGLYAKNAQVRVTNCQFLRNGSGGIRLLDSTGTCADCLFGDNRGSGAEIQDATVRFDRCVFSNNTGIEFGFAEAGGGLAVGGFATPSITINESIFCQNYADAGGAGQVNCGTLTISNSVLVANHDRSGHGLCTGWISSGGRTSLLNNLIVNNGSMYLYLTEAVLKNNTLVRNGGGYVLDAGLSSVKLRMINDLLWNNGDDFSISKPVILPHDLSIWNCNIEDGDYNSVNGNISVNPDFVGTVAEGTIRGLEYNPAECLTVATVDPPDLVPGALTHRIVWVATNAFYIKQNTREKLTVYGNIQKLSAVGAHFTVVDYRLMEGSLCVDVGINEGAPERDLDGNARPANGGLGLNCDIGVYEFAPKPPVLNLALSVDTQMCLWCEGPPEALVEVQFADQLAPATPWHTLGTFSLTNGLASILDPVQPRPPMRFYRAVLR